jgi:putative flippase GtrA
VNGITKSNWQQFVKFIIVSVLNTIVDFGVYGLLTRGFDYWSDKLSLAHSIALIATTIHSYAWNSYWVFPGAHQSNMVAMTKFLVVSISGLIINIFLFWLSLEMGVNDWVSKIGLMGFLFLWNFVGNKWWVYTEQHYGKASHLR